VDHFGEKLPSVQAHEECKSRILQEQKFSDFNGRCKYFKMKCDSVPQTVKLADLWLGYKREALDYSLKDGRVGEWCCVLNL
jgi:hypothetical protein